MSCRGPLSWIGVTLVFCVGCGVSEGVIARVGDRDIRTEAFQSYLEGVVGEPWASIDGRVAARLLDQFLEEEVVADVVGMAEGTGAARGPGVRSASVRARLAEACGPPPVPTDDAVAAETARRTALTRPARARVRQMLIDDADTADAAWRRLQAGEDFDQVATELGRASDAIGQTGVVAQGTLPEEIDEVIFSLPEGGISRPLQGPGGYHILQVIGVDPAGPPDADEARAQAVQALTRELRRTFLTDCTHRLASDLGVTVFPEHLWFDYRGRYAEAHDAR